MWTKPWTLKEGFLLGGGLIIAGLMLQWSVGPVVWDAFAWPVNAIVLACFMLLIASIYALRKRVYAFRFAASCQAALPALCYAVALTIVMGLTRQTTGGSGLSNMLAFWPFVLIYAYLALILGLVALRRLLHLQRLSRDLPFLLNHLGLFIALTTATLGNADMQRLKMVAMVGQPEWRAADQQGNIHELPLAIELKRFIMEEYADGSPRRFASDIQILTQQGGNMLATVDVNKPVEAAGWKIYQYGYDTRLGAMSPTSIFELVSDPWLPAVYIGIFMMLAGAVCMMMLRRGEK